MENNIENVNTLAAKASTILSEMEIDAVGEVMNISMGAAATAVSKMLDKPVNITTPKVSVEKLSHIDCGPMEPALLVKITYTEGIDGANVMVFRQNDMQKILNQLMGVDGPDEFVVDEISMSAACEVMNQMMGAAATALSEFLGKTVNISTPQASVMDPDNTFIKAMDMDAETDIVSILFDMDIEDVMDTQFVSVFSCEFARSIVSQFTQEPEPAPVIVAPVQQAPAPMAAPPQQQAPVGQPPMMTPPPMQEYGQQAPMGQPQMPQYPQQQAPPPYGADPNQAGYGYPPAGQMQQGYYPPPGYPGYPQYPYGAPMGVPPDRSAQGVNVQSVQFPELSYGHEDGNALMGGNMDLIMNVPLDVEIVIGTTKRKIKDIMDFSQGTVIELDKQAGAPVDVVVNGQLLAHGDVVVIDDNFGVRITEIVGTKELLNSLDQQSR